MEGGSRRQGEGCVECESKLYCYEKNTDSSESAMDGHTDEGRVICVEQCVGHTNAHEKENG